MWIPKFRFYSAAFRTLKEYFECNFEIQPNTSLKFFRIWNSLPQIKYMCSYWQRILLTVRRHEFSSYPGLCPRPLIETSHEARFSNWRKRVRSRSVNQPRKFDYEDKMTVINLQLNLKNCLRIKRPAYTNWSALYCHLACQFRMSGSHE